jgi:CheY-like chemotaxis protein
VQPLRVLVVEDEAISARAAKIMLERIGCEVTDIVDTGEGAIEKAKEQRPDLVLMDIRLKGDLNGLEAMQVIRTSYGIAGIFVSAYSPEELGANRERLADFDFLTKPIDGRELAAAIQKVSRTTAQAAPDETHPSRPGT